VRRVKAEGLGGLGVGELVAVLVGHGLDQNDLLGPGQAWKSSVQAIIPALLEGLAGRRDVPQRVIA
jgi:hypothetical protein